MSDTTTETGAQTPTKPDAQTQTSTGTENTTEGLTEATRKAASFLADSIINRKRPEPKKQEPKQEQEDKPEETKEETTDSTESQEDKPKAEPKPKKVAKKKESEEASTLTPERIADISATAAATAIRQMRSEDEPKKEAEKTIKQKVELPPEFDRDREALEYLEASNAEKYPSLVRRLATYAKKEEDYISKWMEENPGAEFDGDDPSHDAFYSANQPKIDPEDIAAAKEAVKEQKIEKKITEKLEKKYEPRIQAYEQEKARRAVADKTKTAAVNVFSDVLTGINEEYGKAVGDQAKLKEIEDTDKVAAKVATEVTNKYAPLAAETVALHNGVPFSEQNPVHRALLTIGQSLEDKIRELPPGQQLDNEGRSFATREEFMRMDAKRRAKHWIVDEAAMLYVISQQAKVEAEQAYKTKKEELEQYIASRNGNGSHSSKEDKNTEKTTATERKPTPSVSSRPGMNAGSGQSNEPKKTGTDLFIQRLGLK